MNPHKVLAVLVAGAAIAACDSGDINIEPTTSVSNSNNTVNQGGGGSEDDICASYVEDGQTIRGNADADGNCTYGAAFVGPKNNLTVDVLLPALPDGGAHIFTSSLFVGETYRTQAELEAAGIAEGGDGPTLTIEAGATVAFQSNNNFLIVNRGSQILANGTADAPITFTSVSDLDGNVGPEDVQQWGGMIINGFGVSNKCAYNGVRGDAGFELTPGEECSIEAEGSVGDDESHYGGDNDADDSGILRYVVVKHTGAEVASGDELNGISFNAVGSSTVVENLQMYSTYDDGIEMFGGAVNFTNYVALYVRDDSIDIDEGWNGSLTNGLVIQAANDGNHCIEADGIGSYSAANAALNQDFIARGLNSAPTISNLTCIVSPNLTGTHDPGAGWRFREGIHPTVTNSLLITSFAANDTTEANDNYCLRIDDDETNAAIASGDLVISSTIFACQENGRDDEQAVAEAMGNQFATIASGTAADASTAADPDLQLTEGELKLYSVSWATSFVDGAAPVATTQPTAGDILGAVSATADWTAGWTYGIHPDNRAQALWFE
ncbi:MAG TPA: hypothetical protein VFY03_03095 [Woeseiaceae bacterium]|nr:hypothetical protein [Woeseiaceae bacterium]